MHVAWRNSFLTTGEVDGALINKIKEYITEHASDIDKFAGFLEKDGKKRFVDERTANYWGTKWGRLILNPNTPNRASF